MLLKIFGCLLIFSGCGGIGFGMGRDYNTRISQLEQVKKMLFLLEGEIKYNNGGIYESMKKLTGISDNIMTGFFEGVIKDNVATLKEAWQFNIEKSFVADSKLSKEDIAIIEDLGNTIGVTDKETQIKNIDHAMECIDDNIGELKKGKTEKCRLYRTTGIPAGAFLAILFL